MSGLKEVVGKITSVKTEDFKRCHATGFHGGVNPQGELVFEIFEDVQDLSAEFELIRLPGETEIREQKLNTDQLNITRLRHVEVTIPISTIPSIIAWLQEKADKQNQAIAETENETKD